MVIENDWYEARRRANRKSGLNKIMMGWNPDPEEDAELTQEDYDNYWPGNQF